MELQKNGNIENGDQEKQRLDIRKNGIQGKWFRNDLSLEKCKYGKMQIRKNANLGKYEFGNMQIWKKANLKNENLEK